MMLYSTIYPLPYSLSSATSYWFPQQVQAYYYNSVLEPALSMITGDLTATKATVSMPIALLVILVLDFAFVAGFALWLVLSLKGATSVTLMATVAVAKSRRTK